MSIVRKKEKTEEIEEVGVVEVGEPVVTVAVVVAVLVTEEGRKKRTQDLTHTGSLRREEGLVTVDFTEKTDKRIVLTKTRKFIILFTTVPFFLKSYMKIFSFCTQHTFLWNTVKKTQFAIWLQFFLILIL